jgi:hypothetical protein
MLKEDRFGESAHLPFWISSYQMSANALHCPVLRPLEAVTASQNMPVSFVQVVEPQLHESTPMFSAVPSVFAQRLTSEQARDAFSQNNPVEESQIVPWQTQGSAFDLDPFANWHAGPTEHKQACPLKPHLSSSSSALLSKRRTSVFSW